jgi:O-antigen ligase
LLVAGRLGWVGKPAFRWLLAGICLGAVFTLSPGMGGILLVAGIWLWLTNREQSRLAARLALAGGIGAAILFVAALPLTPVVHPTALYLVHVPALGLILAPSGRMMTWTEAARAFLAHPLLGQGIGVSPVLVHYRDPSGYLQTLVDAHDTYLGIAAQCGIVGLAALLALIFWVFIRSRPFRLLPRDGNLARLGFGIAFLGAFAYQGLGGSFENARHLWVLLGLFIAAIRIEKACQAHGATA